MFFAIYLQHRIYFGMLWWSLRLGLCCVNDKWILRLVHIWWWRKRNRLKSDANKKNRAKHCFRELKQDSEKESYWIMEKESQLVPVMMFQIKYTTPQHNLKHLIQIVFYSFKLINMTTWCKARETQCSIASIKHDDFSWSIIDYHGLPPRTYSQRVYVNRILQCICQSQVKSFGLRLILPLPTLSSTFYVHMFRVWSFRSLNIPLCFLAVPFDAAHSCFASTVSTFRQMLWSFFFLSSTALLFAIVIFIQFFMSFVWNFIFRITVCQSSCSPST